MRLNCSCQLMALSFVFILGTCMCTLLWEGGSTCVALQPDIHIIKLEAPPTKDEK